MAVRREHFEAIGGYDEDFTGQSFDDDDLVTRLEMYGCEYVNTNARCIHLYHDRQIPSKQQNSRLQHNTELFHARYGMVLRNVNKEWGKECN